MREIERMKKRKWFWKSREKRRKNSHGIDTVVASDKAQLNKLRKSKQLANESSERVRYIYIFWVDKKSEIIL